MGILREALEVGEYEDVPGIVWTGPEQGTEGI